jgi:gluconolactonase
MKTVACSALWAAVLVAIAACGSQNSSGTGGAGGGGGAATGGTTQTTNVGSGGATGVGGAGTGGRTGTGGAGSGGTVAGGGTVGSGGTVAGGGTVGSGGTVGKGGTVGSGGTVGGGGTVGNGGTVGTGGVSTKATGGTVGGGGTVGSGGSGTGGAPTATRRDGACEAGASYPAPVLTGTPKLISKPSGSASGTYEGPVWSSGNGVVIFSDITFTTPVNPSQILKLTLPSTVSTYLADAGTNGMAVDGNGVIYACSHKVQGIVKLDFAAATFTTVVDTVGGKKFNSPNDLAVRSDGTIYFTDPDYQLGSRTSETGKKGIYRVSPSGTVSVVDDTFNEPNGIALSPDEKILYVADYVGNAVRTFAVAADGSTSGRKDFVTVSSPDGFGMDCLGNLYVASGGSGGVLQVYAPSGTKVGSVTVAASLSNAAFGGADGKTLYLTAGKALYSLDMNLPGYWD